ncbi:TPA: hypothetical protein ACH3X2_004547 [Trebouxia sp. C0005]
MQQQPDAYLLDLPASLLQQVLALCAPAQLARCAAACRLLRQAATGCPAWQQHCLQRWSNWGPDVWKELLQQEAWKTLYAARRQVDLQTDQLVATLVWPLERYGCIAALQQLGHDALDQLRRLAVKQGSLMVGTRYWAKQALTAVLSHLQANSMKRILQQPQDTQKMPEVGALLVAQAHYPCVDVSAVSAYLDRLAEECKHRMAEAGTGTDLEALLLLNQLLFNPPADGSSAASPSPDDTPRQAELPYPMSAWTWEQQSSAADWMIVPSGNAGLGLQGDSENYYDPSNSLLPFVLATRKGIPISLAIVHAAVGRRAGLPIEFVGMPMHFMNKLGAADTPDERFIDVFAGGKVLDREAVKAMMQQNDIPFHENRLQAVGLAEVYTRLCGNLINIYSHSRNTSKQRILLDMLLAISPNNIEYSIRHAQVAVNRDDFDTAINDYKRIAELAGNVAAPGALHPPRAVIQSRISAVEAMRSAWHQQALEQIRRPNQAVPVQFKVGDVIRHRRYHYRGVIYGWDAECKAEEDWMQQMRIDQLPGGRHQPYYHVLVDHRDRPFQSTYVAQENIVRPTPTPTPSTTATTGSSGEASEVWDIWNNRDVLAPHWEHSLQVQHPDIGEYFEGIEPDASCYHVNAYLNFRFPEDWIAAI